MAKNSAQIVTGRLLEIRIDAGYRTVAEVDELFDAIEREVAKLPATQQLVTAADWRQCPVMESKASERVLQRIIALNPRTERSSALASLGSPTAVLQFMRIIREAGLPDRKMFFNSEEQIEWLGEVLTTEESDRLRTFLADGGRAGASYTRVVAPPVSSLAPSRRVASRGRR